MLPLSDVIPARGRALVTLTILLVSALVFACERFLGAETSRTMAHALAFTPASFSIVQAATSTLIPPSAWQFVVNMLLLRIFGETLEDRLGRLRFALLYLLAGIAAALVHVALEPDSLLPVANASGALAGVLGGYFVTYPQSKVLTLAPVSTLLVEVPAVFFLGVWWVIEMVSRVPELSGLADPTLQNPALWSLAGAFVVGVLAARLWRRPFDWHDPATEPAREPL